MARLPELQELDQRLSFRFHQMQPVGEDVRLLLRLPPQ
jgi:type II secretory pathway predicted ATPase ExeA